MFGGMSLSADPWHNNKTNKWQNKIIETLFSISFYGIVKRFLILLALLQWRWLDSRSQLGC